MLETTISRDAFVNSAVDAELTNTTPAAPLSGTKEALVDFVIREAEGDYWGMACRIRTAKHQFRTAMLIPADDPEGFQYALYMLAVWAFKTQERMKEFYYTKRTLQNMAVRAARGGDYAV